MEMAQVKRMEFNASLTAVFELRSVDSFIINASVLEAGNTSLCSWLFEPPQDKGFF